MQRPLETPKLPKLPFFAGNLVLLIAAWVIFSQAARPLAGTPLVALTICVSLAAMAACVPFLADYTRQQDTALDERQRALEALARTTAETAEQIGIAATGLHTITELAQKNLKSAEQILPRWQEKSQEFVQRLAEANSAELESLRREINALRSAEAGKLAAAAEKMAQTAAELARLDAALRKPRPATASGPKPVENSPAPAPANEDFTQLPASPPATVPAAGRSAGEATAAAAAAVPTTPESAPKRAAIAEPAPPAVPDPGQNIAPPEAGVISEVHANALAAAIAAADAMVMEVPHEELGTISPFPYVARPAQTPAASASAPSAEIAAPAPKRGKRAKTAPAAELQPAPTLPLAGEAAAATAIAEPAPGDSASKATGAANTSMLDLAIGDDTPLSTNVTYPPYSANPTVAPFAFKSPPPKPPAKAARTEVPPAEPVESALSSDGATRLIVTAYIGIGNKLFIRGDGPGLNPDKGVPLSFVSIGKWRWETTDATAPVTVRLYKNDQQECTALGPVTLAPGRQQEVTADF